MLCLIFQIFVSVIEILAVLAAIFAHWAEQKNRPPPVSVTDERDGDEEEEHEGRETASTDALQYRLHDLKVATNSFSDHNQLGKGGFGIVYKGLLGGQTVAVKKLHGSSAGLDLANEASLLSSLKHENLIEFLGFCCEDDHHILVYEYAPNGDLYNYLTDEIKRQALSWETRFGIIKGFARGLSYLHHNSQNVIIHRDLKPANVLLDEYHGAKIADFGLSRAFDWSKTHKTTKQLVGTMGYIAPELFYKQHYSTRSDVYSYGQLVLETLAGCTVLQYAQVNQEALSHVVWKQWKEKKPLREIIDSSLHDECPQEQLMTCIMVGLLCVQHDPKKRPNMELVLEMLNGNCPVPAPSFPAFWEGYCDSSISIQPQDARHQDSNASIQFQPPLSPKSNTKKDEGMCFGQLKRFSLWELQVATDNFSNKNVLGRGDFGKVYKGRLADGSLVAVKRLEEYIFRWELQFQTEVEVISMAVHRNLLKLRGFCMTSTERMLVYPYMANGSVASCLRERIENVPPLDLPKRKRIALGAARGLSYLHDHCNPKIIHRDVKAASILLDEDFEAIVGNFGLAKFMDFKDTHVSTVVCGTLGYIAPEYLSIGQSSEKTDVFAYGITLLELITGHRPSDLARLANDDDVMLVDWVKELLRKKNLQKLIDPDLRENNFAEMAVNLIQVALLCTSACPVERPRMSEVVRMIEGDGLQERWEEWQVAELLRIQIQNESWTRQWPNM